MTIWSRKHGRWRGWVPPLGGKRGRGLDPARPTATPAEIEPAERRVDGDDKMGAMMLYWVLKGILTPVLRFFYRVRVEGLEHVPRSGPAILASNHLSFSDSIFLPLVLRRRVTFVAKAEYFDDPKTAWLFRALGQIPVKREGGSAAQGAIDAASEVLTGGELFGIYPEGTRSTDGRLHRGHTGVARLALQCHTPVLAVAMVGTAELQPIGQVRPRVFMPVTIRFSAPMSFERYHDRADDPRVLRQITDEIMFELRQLSGQEYVDSYSARKQVVGVADEARVRSTPPPEPIAAAG